MIVSPSEMRSFLGDINDSEYEYISPIHDDIEKFVVSYCNRNFESASYSKEEYSGDGSTTIALKNFPVTAVDRVAVGNIDIIKICNTSTTSTASVSVLSTGLRLVKDGTANTSITFASNTTMTALVSAINALGNGWSASLLNSTYGGFKSTELIEWYGLSCINTNWVYLKMPDEAEDYIKVDTSTGIIYNAFSFSSGINNIYVDYTGGYTSSTMPKDLKLAVKILTKTFYEKKEEEKFGVLEYRAENLWGIFEKDAIPREAKIILNRYRRKLM